MTLTPKIILLPGRPDGQIPGFKELKYFEIKMTILS